MTATVLITGGAGFLGSHLAERLLAAGYAVRLLDSLDPQAHARGAPLYVPAGAELQVGSVLDREAVARALGGVEAVVHFAAVVGVGQSHYQIARYSRVNLQGTAVLLETLLRHQRRPGSGVGRLLAAGSMSHYGEGRYWCPGCGAARVAGPRAAEQLRRQQWEPRCGACEAALEPRPTDEAKSPQFGSMYALTKYAQEQMCLLFGRTYGLATLALRFFNAYGPRQPLSNPYTGVAAVFASELLAGRRPQVFEDGRQLRDMVSVHDVARACQLGLESPGAVGEALNIASGTPLSVAALAQSLARALGSPLQPVISGRFRRGDARHCIADISAARVHLGYAPEISLPAGMRELADWLRRQARPPGRGQQRATAELAAFGLTG